MKNKTIAVDIDECIAELIDKVLEDNQNKIGDLHLTRDGIIDYYIHNIPGVNIDLPKAIEYFRATLYKDEDKFHISPIIGAKEKLEEFKRAGYNLNVVTARPSLFEEYTVNWIDRHFKNIFSDICFGSDFTDKHIKKSELCKKINASYMIEDNHEYALDVASSGVHTFLFNKPWNTGKKDKDHSKIYRVDKWKEIKID